MGIDIYAHWSGQTDAERDAQCTGFSIAHGHVGYLREAYHGEPYATKVLVPEAFDDARGEGVPIAAATLRKRLRKTLATARARQLLVYKEGADSDDTTMVCKSFTEFVELCEAQERATGTPCIIQASY
jgi:hypothetical protein